MLVDNSFINVDDAQAWQFWRLAMSIAVASGSRSTVDDISKSIGNAVEELYSQCSITDKTKRQQQLTNIIQHCFELKQRLDRQKHTYRFRHSPRRIPYNAEYMRSSSSPPASQEIVKCSLWPMLTKLVAHETWEVVEREVVRTGLP
ncbi:hypothetical protein N7510_000027 [Penicillium lagena]|uniref:uncharacterized protein n=1 Tax=Penicillium lagena TaxID=94218 RepID=UPI002541DE1E|nr:uncharacterized protein N7510_000027 [Penicillium lagena]KAJ5623718.1 hypothetical protein N7510_000027 [Penicillium lagena]